LLQRRAVYLVAQKKRTANYLIRRDEPLQGRRQ